MAVKQVYKGLLGADASRLTGIRALVVDKALSDVDFWFYWILPMGLAAIVISNGLLKMLYIYLLQFAVMHLLKFTWKSTKLLVPQKKEHKI